MKTNEEIIYDKKHLKKMINLFGKISAFQKYKKGEGAYPYDCGELWENLNVEKEKREEEERKIQRFKGIPYDKQVIKVENEGIVDDFSREIYLNDNDLKIIYSFLEQNGVDKKEIDSYKIQILKKITDKSVFYHKSEFMKRYLLLTEKNKKTIIEMIDDMLTYEVRREKQKEIKPTSEDKIRSTSNFSINLQILLDALNITQAQLDNELDENRAVAKLLYKKTESLQYLALSEKIAKSINNILAKRAAENTDLEASILKDGYIDGLVEHYNMFTRKYENSIDVTLKFYLKYPITAEDLEEGRITCSDELKKKYGNYDEWVGNRYAVLKKQAKEFIYHLTYELFYRQNVEILEAEYTNFRESMIQNGVVELKENEIILPFEYKCRYFANYLKNYMSEENSH